MFSRQDDAFSRRDFLKTALGGSLALALTGCRGSDPIGHIIGEMHNPDAATGHLLRNPGAIPPASGPAEDADVVIIGGGISGLSALRALRMAGVRKVVLLELEAEAGGNSGSGKSPVTAFPWGAHYIPVPDPSNIALLQFLEEAGAITGYRGGLPVYNEYHLCAAPEERLFLNGYWQEGIIPATGISARERAQIERFLALTASLKKQTGSDGRPLFAIPLDNSSADPTFRALDEEPFSAYLDREGFTAAPLRWYLEYCCKDDYGLPLTRTSAWAGLHYFASRRGSGANAAPGDVLTWPEGNGFLAAALRRPHESSIRSRRLAGRVSRAGGEVMVDAYDAGARTTGAIRCKKVVMAVPHFIARHLFRGGMGPGRDLNLVHTPWMVANISLKDLPQGSGQGTPMSWDNVLYGTPSVGYINATQQIPGGANGMVITYYKPLLDGSPQDARAAAGKKPWRAWVEEVVAELSTAHPGISKSIERVDVRIWGHGMVGPAPGAIWGGGRIAAAAPIDNVIFFAHTDYSGISLFEEAFYQGLRAAEQIMATI